MSGAPAATVNIVELTFSPAAESLLSAEVSVETTNSPSPVVKFSVRGLVIP
jgi:hypothetical protein